MKALIIDHKDSFTYNLRQLLIESGANAVELIGMEDDIESAAMAYKHIVLSPGPGLPDQRVLNFIKNAAPMKNILGICLGHQSIAMAWGALLYNLPSVMHGVQSKVCICNNDPLFHGLENPFMAGLYHSWAVAADSLPKELIPLATNENGVLMALRHKYYNLYGLQFHPESFMTPTGKSIISNWLYEN